MHGPLVPLVLIPRFTSYVGPGSYASVPLELSRYAFGSVTLWRGPLVGSSPTYRAYLETSRDGVVWDTVFPIGWDPGANNFEELPVAIMNRLFRIRVLLAGTGAAVTNWCTGSLELRVE